MIFALDTDIFTQLGYGHSKVVARYTAVLKGGAEVAVPAVDRAEVLRGRFDALTKAASGQDFLNLYGLLDTTERALARNRTLAVTPQAGATFDTLLKVMKKLGKRNRSDLLVAAVAIAHQATLVTANTQHFANIPGLTVEDWTR